jgi:hypothetical protein
MIKNKKICLSLSQANIPKIGFNQKVYQFPSIIEFSDSFPVFKIVPRRLKEECF